MTFEGSPIEHPIHYEPRSAWLRHGPFGMWLVHALRPQRLVELGTHHGYSYFCFCQAVVEAGLDTQCFAVDTWQGDEHAGIYDETTFRHVQALNAPYAGFSTLLRKTFAEALEDIEEGSVDLLHVDGRHFYDDVKEDFESWIPKLSSRAVVLFHDTGVRDANFGVWRYWSEISDRRPSINFPYQHGLGVLFWGANIAPGLRSFISLLQDPEEIARIYGMFEKAGEEVVANAGSQILGRVKMETLSEDVAELHRMVRMLYVSSVRSEAELAMALTALGKERSQPLRMGLRNKLAFKLLRLLIKASPLLSARTVARYRRSASKRSPDRGLLWSDYHL